MKNDKSSNHVHTLSKEIPVQIRRAQHVGLELENAIRGACRRSPAVSACYLLDTRRKDNGKTVF
jgi:hypothetical protein